MDFSASEWLNLVLRWIHVVAGILWIGHLYFFNFVNAQVAKTYDADSKKKVVPELMPRALYFFRWGALWTWVTGFLLLLVVYWFGGALLDEQAPMGRVHGMGGAAFVLVAVGFAVYDVLWKRVLKDGPAGALVSFVLLAGFVLLLRYGLHLSGRAVFIHVGILFGTIMAANVWMRIWPNQRKIIAGIKGTGPAPDASVAAMAGLRSKHNTYMSVPLVLTMVSNHFPGVYGAELGWAVLLVLVLVGWGATRWLYVRSAAAAAAAF